MREYALGTAFMVFGLVIFIAGKALFKSTSVATNGESVAVGSDNSAPTSDINATGSPPPVHSYRRSVTLVSVLVELIGITINLLHYFLHLAPQ